MDINDVQIEEISAKNILVKSDLSNADYVINPYFGCTHGCVYCYAKFMTRFSDSSKNYSNKEWGSFCNVKLNAPMLVPNATAKNIEKYENKTIVLSSVTDAYNPLDEKYQLTRKILKRLIPLRPRLQIITKSSLVLRDLDILEEFDDVTILISLGNDNQEHVNLLEPNASSVKDRINTLKQLNSARKSNPNLKNLKIVLFMSPIFPLVSDFKSIIDKTKDYVDEFWFENLNVRSTNWQAIVRFLKNVDSQLVKEYKSIYYDTDNYYRFWQNVKEDIRTYCQEQKLTYNIFFHHGKRTI